MSDLPSPIQFGDKDISLTLSTDESLVDPIERAKLPGAKPVLPKMSKVKILCFCIFSILLVVFLLYTHIIKIIN